MDPASLKQEFGRDLVFWGAGVDTHSVLDKGSPAQVREDVRRRVEALAPGGGWIWASIHNMLSNVRPENILAAVDAAHDFGEYPIACRHSSAQDVQQAYADYWMSPMSQLKESNT